MYQQEEWKIIKEFPKYQVSNKGRIKSITKGKEYILSPYYKNGYLIVSLCKKTPKGKESIRKDKRVHRIVAQYFCDNYTSKCEVHHKDLNRSNNNSDNLLCLTQQEHRKLHKELRREQLKKKLEQAKGKDNGGC